jgi:hypothetical protein
MATLVSPFIPDQPATPRNANGIAHSNPKADRAAVKAAWVTWVADWKAFNVDGVGSDPGPFDYAGFTYADE